MDIPLEFLESVASSMSSGSSIEDRKPKIVMPLDEYVSLMVLQKEFDKFKEQKHGEVIFSTREYSGMGFARTYFRVLNGEDLDEAKTKALNEMIVESERGYKLYSEKEKELADWKRKVEKMSFLKRILYVLGLLTWSDLK